MRTKINSLADLHARCEVMPSGCIEYRGNGKPLAHYYGIVTTCFGRMTPCRAALALSIGSHLPSDKDACHVCDNPLCTNPAHLFLASRAANMRDKLSKNRWAKGKTISDEVVMDILRRWNSGSQTQKEIAGEFGLSEVTVNYICIGKRHRKLWEQFKQQQITV
jgi:HNH endonuclease